MSGSKMCHLLDDSSTAAGRITSLKKVVKEFSIKPNECFNHGDVDIFFDNTQTFGKTRRVREGGSTPDDISTNVVFIKQH